MAEGHCSKLCMTLTFSLKEKVSINMESSNIELSTRKSYST